MTRRKHCATIGAAAGLLGLGLSPHATAAWTPPVEVAAGGLGLTSIDIAVNARGVGIGAWVQRERGGSAIRYVDRRSDGSWTPPRVLNFDRDFPLGSTRVAMDDEGRATVIWTLRSGNVNPPTFLQAATREPGGEWTKPVTLSKRFVGFLNASVATTDGGRVVVAWAGLTDANKSRAFVETAVRNAGGRWRLLPRLGRGEPGFFVEPRLWPLGRGAVGLSWVRNTGRRGARVPVVLATLDRQGSRWTEPATVGPTPKNVVPSIAVEPSGAMVSTLWTMPRQTNGKAAPSGLAVTSRAAGGPWRSGAPLGIVGPFDSPSVAIGGGVGVVALSRTLKNHGPSTLEAALVSADGTVSTPAVLARREGPPGGGTRAQRESIEAITWALDTAVTASGRVLVLWSIPQLDEREPMLRSAGIAASTREPGGEWSPAEQVVRFDTPSLAPNVRVRVYGSDQALAYWVRGDESSARLFVSQLD
jgi:hypothetical protein